MRLTNLDEPSNSLDANISGPGVQTVSPEGEFELERRLPGVLLLPPGRAGAGQARIHDPRQASPSFGSTPRAIGSFTSQRWDNDGRLRRRLRDGRPCERATTGRGAPSRSSENLLWAASRSRPEGPWPHQSLRLSRDRASRLPGRPGPARQPHGRRRPRQGGDRRRGACPRAGTWSARVGAGGSHNGDVSRALEAGDARARTTRPSWAASSSARRRGREDAARLSPSSTPRASRCKTPGRLAALAARAATARTTPTRPLPGSPRSSSPSRSRPEGRGRTSRSTTPGRASRRRALPARDAGG